MTGETQSLDLVLRCLLTGIILTGSGGVLAVITDRFRIASWLFGGLAAQTVAMFLLMVWSMP